MGQEVQIEHILLQTSWKFRKAITLFFLNGMMKPNLRVCIARNRINERKIYFY